MRKNDYSFLRDLRLVPICSEKCLQHLGETISRLRLEMLVLVGLVTENRPLLRIRFLLENVKAGSHQPWGQMYVGFNFENAAECQGTLLGLENLTRIELIDCKSLNGLISMLGEKGELGNSLNPIGQVNTIQAILSTHSLLGQRVEIEKGLARCKIHLISTTINSSKETLTYLRLNVYRNFDWLRMWQNEAHLTPKFFKVRHIIPLSTYQNLRQLSLCLYLFPGKTSRVCRVVPPRLELLELSYGIEGVHRSIIARELMLMTYALKRRSEETMWGYFPLKCIFTTELKYHYERQRNCLHSRLWLVDGESGRVQANELGRVQDLLVRGQRFPGMQLLVKISLGVIPHVL
ncbi:hypothetical protein L873DRAFT_1837476 [Choiromyces venosus 120613-1]|uniref:Uncharacterized protein n=1 Tax=Choiromyces venosus 120613-1 TaxID=1336337 RepID=A0A3N4JDQ2_9PEZI|nr:hypothetical protein L873DRAFT_1837476 [Choiromyces venosus 120613-1]